MAKSFVPEGINVVCTEMQSTVPEKLGRDRRESFLSYKKENAPLLNIVDKKLSGELQCKISTKFWGGLQVLCAALAIGALAIATVATGGLALVAAGVFLGAALVSAGSGVTAIYTTFHSCDATLKSSWILEHDSVYFEGEQALLQDSVLMCQKGGAVSLIMDDALALSLAKTISDNNGKEVLAHMGSQFLQGGITAVTALTPIGILVAAPLSGYFYVGGENEKQELRTKNLEAFYLEQAQKETTLGEQVEGAVQQEAIGNTAGITGGIIEEAITVTATNRAITQEATEYSTEAFTRGLAGDVAGATNAQIASQMASHSHFNFSWKNVFDPKGLGLGLAGAVVNFGIEYYSDKYEDGLYEENKSVTDKLKQQDLNININSHIR